MKSKLSLLCLAALAVIGSTLLSCSKESTDISDSSKDIPLTPIEMTRSMEDFIRGGNLFSYRLLQQEVMERAGSFMVSPLSLSFALSMAMEAAEEGAARDNVLEMLGFGSGGQKEIREYCSTMLKTLPKLSRTTTISLANLLVADNAFGNVDPDYERVLKADYDARVESLPFNDPIRVANLINEWAKENTNGLIPKIVKTDDIYGRDAFLANALYFKGVWTSPFKKSHTSEDTFTREDNVRIKLPMMNQKDIFLYSESTLFRTVRLPFGNGAFVMDVILPQEGYSVKDVASFLAEGGDPFENAKREELDLSLPRFSNNGKIDLLPCLNLLSDNAIGKCVVHFSDSRNHRSQINDVFQGYSIKVDENGAEAASVTIVPGITSSALRFHADHPFIYTISETSTGAVLFAGVFRGDSD